MNRNEQKIIRELLRSEFEKRRRKNAAYSQRAFAKTLGLNSGTLNSILSGKRELSPKAAQSLLKRLKLEKNFEGWLHQILEKKNTKGEIEVDRTLLEIDRFEIISSPIHLNALNLLRTSKAIRNVEWLAKKMKCELSEMTAVVGRLERAGLLKIENGELAPTSTPIKTPDNFPHHAIRAFHKSNLLEASSAIESIPIDLRDFSTITIPADPAKIEEVRELIKKFRDQVSFLLGSSNSPEVYKLSIQYYPVAMPEESR